MDVNRSADCRIQRFRIRTIDDRQIEVLLLLLSLLLMAMPVVMMMPTAPTWIFVLLYLCLSCRVSFACTIFIIVIRIIYASQSGSMVPEAPYSVHLLQTCRTRNIWTTSRTSRSSSRTCLQLLVLHLASLRKKLELLLKNASLAMMNTALVARQGPCS